jgi:hypothetical protein
MRIRLNYKLKKESLINPWKLKNILFFHFSSHACILIQSFTLNGFFLMYVQKKPTKCCQLRRDAAI